jgi:rSAM/selenodomain-associated transferase 2
MTSPLSIIIPVLNEAQTLPVLLADLQPLRKRGVEIIVVDGGSSDATAELAQDGADRLLESAAGRARQMNAGAAVARGAVLLFLHADTRLPGNVEAWIDAAMAQEHVWGRFDVRLSGQHWLLRIIEKMMNWRSCLSGMATGDQAIFVRREVFEQLDGYADIPLMEDLDLSRRLKKIARPACIDTPVITSSRRWEQNGILRTVLLMWSLRLAWFLGVSPQLLRRIYYPQDTRS